MIIFVLFLFVFQLIQFGLILYLFARLRKCENRRLHLPPYLERY